MVSNTARREAVRRKSTYIRKSNRDGRRWWQATRGVPMGFLAAFLEGKTGSLNFQRRETCGKAF
jgi:hypothetical protein